MIKNRLYVNDPADQSSSVQSREPREAHYFIDPNHEGWFPYFLLASRITKAEVPTNSAFRGFS